MRKHNCVNCQQSEILTASSPQTPSSGPNDLACHVAGNDRSSSACSLLSKEEEEQEEQEEQEQEQEQEQEEQEEQEMRGSNAAFSGFCSLFFCAPQKALPPEQTIQFV